MSYTNTESKYLTILKREYELKGCFNPNVCDLLGVKNYEKCLIYVHSLGGEWDMCTCEEVNNDINKCVKNGLYKLHVLSKLQA